MDTLQKLLVFCLITAGYNCYPMDQVKLKNGTEVYDNMVPVTMLSLEGLIEKNPIAFYELVMKCRNKNHKYFGNTGEVISSYFGNEIHDIVKNIVLSATEGDGLDMRLTSPYAPEVQEEKLYCTKTISLCATVGELPLESLKDYYARLQKIAMFIGGETNKMIDESKSPNPFYNQIVPDGSVALEMYYGKPSKFWTPLGHLRIGIQGANGGEVEKVMKIITEKLKLKEIIPGKQKDMGYFGPVYQIGQDLDGKPFPGNVTLIKDKEQKIPYDEAIELWKKVKPQVAL